MKTQKIKQLAAVVGLACGMASMSTFAGTITGSAHDFKAATWNASGEICVVCHAPHNNQASILNAPLWNHTPTAASHTMYTGFDIDGTVGTAPNGASLLCLSCHDGTVAVDSFGGNTPVPTNIDAINANANLGVDLSNDHPISVTYDDVNDTELHPAATTDVTIGDGVGTTGSIANLLLAAGEVQCSSCHDVHNTNAVTGTKLLVKSNAGSALCLTCHNK
ncbi:MAG: cytochrome c3 family protein [Gammaproteobacteria bacterium]|nr:cytochrome c3 family protein [Gammaproteobacteria bacterium]